MKKHINTLFALAAIYIAVYVMNILFVIINYSAILFGRSPSLSFGSQISFAGWGLPLAIVIAVAVVLMNAAYTSTEKK